MLPRRAHPAPGAAPWSGRRRLCGFGEREHGPQGGSGAVNNSLLLCAASARFGAWWFTSLLVCERDAAVFHDLLGHVLIKSRLVAAT